VSSQESAKGQLDFFTQSPEKKPKISVKLEESRLDTLVPKAKKIISAPSTPRAPRRSTIKSTSPNHAAYVQAFQRFRKNKSSGKKPDRFRRGLNTKATKKLKAEDFRDKQLERVMEGKMPEMPRAVRSWLDKSKYSRY